MEGRKEVWRKGGFESEGKEQLLRKGGVLKEGL